MHPGQIQRKKLYSSRPQCSHAQSKATSKLSYHTEHRNKFFFFKLTAEQIRLNEKGCEAAKSRKASKNYSYRSRPGRPQQVRELLFLIRTS